MDFRLPSDFQYGNTREQYQDDILRVCETYQVDSPQRTSDLH